MLELKFEPKEVNLRQLDTELKTALPGIYAGLSRDSQGFRLHINDQATPEDLNIAEAIFLAHIPLESDNQREQRFRNARIQALEILKAMNDQRMTLLDVERYLHAIKVLLIDGD